jgi:long-chain acyl-CoA synthetase
MEKPWLKYYDEGVPAALDYPDIPVDHLLARAAARYPELPATIFGARVGARLMDAKISYRQLNDSVNRFAAALQRMGVKKGDRVGIMLPSCPQFIVAAYGTWRIGGIVVCCNPLYVAREIEHLANDSGAETFVVMSSLYERLQSVRGHTGIKQVVLTSIKEYFPALLRVLFTLTKEKKEGHRVDISGAADTFWFQDLIRNAPAQPAPVEIHREDVAVLIYTGGTTGGPKGAQLTHRNLVSNATLNNVWAKSKAGQDLIVSVMPFFHSYGLTVGMNTPIANSLTSILIPNPRDLQHVLMAIQKHHATFYPGVPTMVVGMNNFPGVEKYALSSLRFAVSAAAPLAPEVQQRFEDITGCKMLEAYGLTETSPVASMDPVGRPKDHSVGVPVPDTDIKIVDVETGTKELPPGESGEIIIKGPQVMKGYWNLPEATAKALRVGPDGEPGWFYSADIGYMDEEGYIHMVDRKKDMIIAGAYNIYPTDVEAVLFEHPKVKEAAVIGIPDEQRGETVKAFVVLKEGEAATPEEIMGFCRERMAAYKSPRLVEFRSDLPKSLIGKVLRRKLREEEAQRAGKEP